MQTDFKSTRALSSSITRAASSQTYYTIRLLVDRGQVANACRAYAYFRWVDDWLDGPTRQKSERAAFVDRQTALIENCYRGVCTLDVSAEEQMLVDLIRSDSVGGSGLASYIKNMMSVMAFDSERRGRLISQAELNAYERLLAVSVTEALHHFIGHDQAAPLTAGRYLAAAGAHITHMLRDTWEDIPTGYFNIPAEFLEMHGIAPSDVESVPYRVWVKSRVELARRYFQAGRDYLTQVRNPRCRLAACAYMARFEIVLDMIERDGYVLRRDYGAHKGLGAAGRMSWSILCSILEARQPQAASRALPAD